MSKSNKKIVVAMSGGVDSSVAAALLKQAGFDVVGIFMKFWSAESASRNQADKKDFNRCCSVEAENLARAVARKIGIPFYVINVEKEFKKKVVDYFLREYKKGNTPNPCIVCNKEIKFGFLINKALTLGADFIATGHYAQISFSHSATNFFPSAGKPPLSCRTSGPGTAKSLLPCSCQLKLFKGKDKNKDQSYFLWQLNQKQLSRVLFPVGQYTKPEVRKLAKKFNLPTAETPESQEVCFVPKNTNEFLQKYLKNDVGRIVDKSGKVLGKHNGLWFYTIGQRKGLEIPQGPWFVIDKNFKNNTLIVSRDKKDLLKKELIAKNINWLSPQKLPMTAEVKIRYKSALVKAKILKNKNNNLKIVFSKPQQAITPGQSAVFYEGEKLLGGGIIR